MADVYLDNSATTRPYPEVIELISKIQSETYGNPSSMHEKGLAAEKLIREARRQIALFFNGREKEIIFTSGGTEANNLAILGAAYRNRQRGNHLITSPVEHPSVLNCFHFLEQEGYAVSYLPVDRQGTVSPDDIRALIRKDTVLASIMHVNNEVGSIQPLKEIGRAIKEENPAVLFHIDAVQSFARLPLKVKDWLADL
ncbi:MAG: aminotransferase class V-fold PLP-dependent enzyme, partial [Clostridia bacterium]|nr:aminotransferase class V-fold PLP-dependent enzyme [Clostridia bacterium]